MCARPDIRANSAGLSLRYAKAGGDSLSAESGRKGENHRHTHTEGVDAGRR
jgi:hypothetical protein